MEQERCTPSLFLPCVASKFHPIWKETSDRDVKALYNWMHPGMSTHSEIFNVKGNPRDKADEEELTTPEKKSHESGSQWVSSGPDFWLRTKVQPVMDTKTNLTLAWHHPSVYGVWSRVLVNEQGTAPSRGLPVQTNFFDSSLVCDLPLTSCASHFNRSLTICALAQASDNAMLYHPH